MVVPQQLCCMQSARIQMPFLKSDWLVTFVELQPWPKQRRLERQRFDAPVDGLFASFTVQSVSNLKQSDFKNKACENM
jgi:hypothetical protein